MKRALLSIAAILLTISMAGCDISAILGKEEIVVEPKPAAAEVQVIIEENAAFQKEMILDRIEQATRALEDKKAEAKNQIKDWYTSHIASIKNLEYALGLENIGGDLGYWFGEYCILNTDRMPEYSAYRSYVEIPECIGSYLSALRKLTIHQLDNFDDEDEMQARIEEIAGECGIIIDNGEVSFRDIPRLVDEADEEKEKIYVITDGIRSCIVTNKNMYEKSYSISLVWTRENGQSKTWWDTDLEYYADMMVASQLDTANEIYTSTGATVGSLGEREYTNLPEDLTITIDGKQYGHEMLWIADILESTAVIFEGEKKFEEFCQFFAN